MIGYAATASFAVAIGSSALAWRRAERFTAHDPRAAEAKPSQYAAWTALCASVPVVFFLLAAMLADGPLVEWLMLRAIPPEMTQDERPSLVLGRLSSIAGGGQVFGEPTDQERRLADYLLWLNATADRIVAAGALALAVAGGALALRAVHPAFRARQRSEAIVRWLLLLCATIATLTTIAIVAALAGNAVRFFTMVPAHEFFFGLSWAPDSGLGEGQRGELRFGIVPVLLGSLLIMLIAMAVAVPVGILAAIYMVEFAPARVRGVAKPVLEILAGVPTVVYGFFAAILVAPAIADAGAALGLDTSHQSALAAGLVMGVMIIPFVSSLSDDALDAVPQRLREGAYTLGATHGETIVKVVLPAASPGLLSAIVLAVSRALGETMIVVMAAGLYANLTFNPLQAVTTITVQITSALTGDQPFDSAFTLSAFSLALTLFVLTFALNFLGLQVLKRYQEKYE
jgi:phosphate transport system permease protein